MKNQSYSIIEETQRKTLKLILKYVSMVTGELSILNCGR